MSDSPNPGEGPVRPVSVSLHEGTIAALRARTGKRGMSAYVEALIQRELERDRLRGLIADAEASHGPVDRAAVDAKRAVLRGGQPRTRPTPRQRHAGTRL